MAAVRASVAVVPSAPSKGGPQSPERPAERPSPRAPKRTQDLEFTGVFKGRELTRKDRRLASGLAQLDAILSGGIARGRISEILGPASSGKTAVAASFAASATRMGEVAAWIDLPGAFDPASVEAAGADLSRILWVSLGGRSDRNRSPFPNSRPPGADHESGEAGRREYVVMNRRRRGASTPWGAALKAAELVLEAGGFGLVVVDFGAMRFELKPGAALRLARAAERSGTAVLVVAARRMCGTFAALSLNLGCVRTSFGRIAPGAPAIFDGLAIEAQVTRNKTGVSGHRARFDVMVDPPSGNHPDSVPLPGSTDGRERILPIPRIANR